VVTTSDGVIEIVAHKPASNTINKYLVFPFAFVAAEVIADGNGRSREV